MTDPHPPLLFAPAWVAGISHKTTPIDLREKFAIGESARPSLGAFLRSGSGVEEQVILSTCNRVEIYGAGTDPRRGIARALEMFERHTGLLESVILPHLYGLAGRDAVRHLFGVASGLDSLALGETEILGQVKTAYLHSHQAGLTGRTLNTLFQKALTVGKKVRTQTAVGEGKVSVASIAVDLARKIFYGLKDKTVLVIGSGEVAGQVCEALSADGVAKLWIANRHQERAEGLAALHRGEALPFEQIDARAAEADIILSSAASPKAIIHRDRVESWRRGRRRALFLVDLGVPRNIDSTVSELNDVYLYNVDDLNRMADENRRLRREAAVRGWEIVDEAVERLRQKMVLGESVKEFACESWRLENSGR